MSSNKEEVKEESAVQVCKEGVKESILICGKKVKNRKVALVICYLGAGYQGMQRNPNAKTIEADLEKALYAAKGIPDDVRFNYGRLQWSRSARTDKGVSALTQVVSLDMLVPHTDPQDMAKEINNHLPMQIQILDLVRTTPSFDAKNLCDYRVYEYLVPLFTLNPETCKSAEELVDVLSRTRGKEQQLEKLDEILSEALGEKYHQNLLSRTVKVDIHQLSADIDEPQIPQQFSVNEHENSFSLTTELVALVNRLLRVYEGTHNFYNFTSREKATNPSVNRFIRRFRVDALVKLDGECWLSLSVCGQSFLLYQIRKMIGLVLAIIRKEAPEDAIETAFIPTRDLNVPPAPAASLYLNECNFGAYNQKWPDRQPLEPVKQNAEQIQDFKENVLYPYIHSFCKATKVFESYCYSLRDAVYKFSKWKQMEEIREMPKYTFAKRQRQDEDDKTNKRQKCTTKDNNQN